MTALYPKGRPRLPSGAATIENSDQRSTDKPIRPIVAPGGMHVVTRTELDVLGRGNLAPAPIEKNKTTPFTIYSTVPKCEQRTRQHNPSRSPLRYLGLGCDRLDARVLP